MSIFRISIVRDDGEPVLLYPGARGERDLVAEIVRRVQEKPVGFFTSKERVVAAVESSIADALHELKSEVVPS